MRRSLLTAFLCLAFFGVASAQKKKPGAEAEPVLPPWPGAVPGWQKPEPGEHPRLFFRKADLPALRERAKTPEGQALIRRLKFLVGGGEIMTPSFNPYTKAYEGKIDLPEGTYTISHAAGLGFLYQLTGEKHYADLGRLCMEKALEGARDIDPEARYAFRQPGGALRAGPSIAWYAAAYDLCYDGWTEVFREKVAAELQNYNEGEHMDIGSMAAGRRHAPGSNHWGPQIAGPAMVALAIQGDPGTDDAKVAKLLETSEKSFLRELGEGWGERGWFAEGDGPGAIASDTAFVPALQAWRVAGGKDFISPRPDAQFMTMKWVMLTVPDQTGKPPFPFRGTYEHNIWARAALSGSGTFAQGFGAVADRYKPYLLWLYDRCFKALDDGVGKPFDTVSPYPHRAMLAFLNWPFGMEPQNPGELFPCAIEDKPAAHYIFRNRWQDENDIVATALLKPSKGNYAVPAGDILVYGLGFKTQFPAKLDGAQVTGFQAAQAGGVVSTKNGSFGADFSMASGSDALFVLTGTAAAAGVPFSEAADGKFKTFAAIAGGHTFVVMSLSETAQHPTPEVGADGALLLGGQEVRVDEAGNLAFATLSTTLSVPMPTGALVGKPVQFSGIRYQMKTKGPVRAEAVIGYRRAGEPAFKPAPLASTGGVLAGAIPAEAVTGPLEVFVRVKEQPVGGEAIETYWPRGAPDKPALITPDTGPPTPPGDLRAAELRSYGVRLAWQPATDDIRVAGYRLTRDGEPLGRAEPDATGFLDADPPAGRKAEYAVAAADAAGQLGAPAVLTLDVPADTPPENRLKLLAVETPKGVALSWSGLMEPDVNRLLVLRARGPEGAEFAQVADLDPGEAAGRWLDAGAAALGGLRYAVKLVDKGGNESEAGPAAAAEKGAYVRRINCGGDRVTGADGIEWEADTGNIFNTGRFKAGVRIEGAPDDMQPIYQSERWANAGLRYRFPVEPGDYEVILYLAESNKEFMEAGKRTFDVAINNEVVKAAVDVFAQAEGANKALELRFLTKPDPAGDIVVDLRKGVAGPALKGVEVRAVEVVE